MVKIHDLEGKYLYVNKVACDTLGYSNEEIAKLPVPASYYSEEDIKRAVLFIENVYKDGSGTIELELICKNGNKIPTEYRVSLMNDKNSHAGGDF